MCPTIAPEAPEIAPPPDFEDSPLVPKPGRTVVFNKWAMYFDDSSDECCHLYMPDTGTILCGAPPTEPALEIGEGAAGSKVCSCGKARCTKCLKIFKADES